MSADLTNALSAAVKRLLYPLVRVMLRQGIAFGAFSDLVKQVYVEVAAEEFGLPGRKQTISRIAIITGLTRKEVKRVRQLPQASDASAIAHYNRAARVVAGWRRHPDFLDSHGEPALLPLEGDATDSPSFSLLVQRFSGDIPVRAVKDELLRIGTIEETANKRLRLLSRAYVPQGDDLEKIAILGMDVADLLYSIDHNIAQHNEAPYFQRKVAYDNLPADALPAFKSLVARQGQSLLEEFDHWLAERDQDANPHNTSCISEQRKRAGVGIYYFEADVDSEALSEETP